MVAILVAATLIIFALVEGFLRLSRVGQPTRQPPLPFDPEPLPGHFLHPGHTWAELQRNGQIRIGADEFVRKAAGDIDGVVLPGKGQTVCQGEPLLTLTSGARRMVLMAPLSGTILSSNQDAASGPLSPHRWLCALHPSTLASELSQLRIAEEATSWTRRERDRLVDWLTLQSKTTAAMTLPDGGLPVRGFLRTLDPAAWRQFEDRFLRTPSPGEEPAGEASS